MKWRIFSMNGRSFGQPRDVVAGSILLDILTVLDDLDVRKGLWVRVHDGRIQCSTGPSFTGGWEYIDDRTT